MDVKTAFLSNSSTRKQYA